MKRPYNFKKVKFTWGPYTLHGFMTDSSIEVDTDEERVTKEVGADGEVCRVFSNNESGAITFNLQQSSSSNDDLSAAANRDAENEDEVWSAQIEDLNGTTLVYAAEAWLTKIAPSPFAKAHGGRTWKLDCAKLIQWVGGAATS
jgi:hypothetical protein